MTRISEENAVRSAQALDELASVFATYNETTERMNLSHRQLQSEVVRLREELEQKNEQLERKSRLAALGEMAAGMAHEIRNPLGGIRLYASLLERDLETEENKVKWVRKIIKGVHSLDQIVSDILAFTHEQMCEKNQVNLRGLLQDVLDYVYPRSSGEIEIDISSISGDLMLEADVDMMHRVFLNLLLNAVEAVEGNGRVEIRAVSCNDEPPYSRRITIADNGGGIKGEVMSKIFDPFFTTKDSGTGLGLAIVHRLVECHGGLISAANNEIGGATFSILLL